jgi:LacI family transcriptional regulator
VAVRLKDIADDLGVSLVTVSKVLRDHPDVGPKTRERVLKRVREMNYRPNRAARSLVTGQTYNVGLIVPDLVHCFFAEVAKGATPVLREKDYNLLISSSEEEPELERKETEHLIANGVDVLLIASAQAGSSDFFAQLAAQGTAFVLIDREIPGVEANFVGVDDEAVGLLATRHLISLGYRRIAHIGGTGVSTAEGRLRGYARALSGAGIAYDPSLVVRREQIDRIAEEAGFTAMEHLLRLDTRPEAVFCFNDPMAIGAMKAIFHAGLRLPHDIAIAGAGNVPYTDFFRVPLTTVDQNSVQIGRKAAELALELLAAKRKQDDRPTPRRILLEPKLLVRESTQRPA